MGTDQELKKIALAIAERELGETETTRCEGVESVKRFIKELNYIKKCRLDSRFLLRFLRVKKFDVAKSQDILERYLFTRCTYPQWFNRLDIDDEAIHKLVTKGFAFVLPERDDFGRRVLFSVGTSVVPGETNCNDTMRAMVMTLEALMEDEETQILGLTYVFDHKALSLNHLAIWNPKEFQQAFTSSENALPVRHKGVHFMHLPILIRAGFAIFKSFLSSKLRDRVQVHSDVDSLVNHVPVRILPKEYGGEIPMKDMIDMWIEELQRKRSALLALDEMEMDLDKRKQFLASKKSSIRSWLSF